MLFLLLALIVFLIILAAFPGPLPKLRWIGYSMNYALQCHDLPGKNVGSSFIRPTPPQGTASNNENATRVIRVVFVRHGQSAWNSIMNSFGLGWPVRVVRALVLEGYYFWAKPRQSLFIDSPLSSRGLREARDLRDFLRASKGFPVDSKNSIIVSSNLRRAMETAVIGLSNRVSLTHERIYVDSYLQEGTRNIDGQSFATTPGKLSDSPIQSLTTQSAVAALFDPSYNLGNKDLSSTLVTRTVGFINRLFALGGAVPYAPVGGTNADLKSVVVVGHSGWFRTFFQRFLPESSTHVAKSKKMQNCACVAFDLTYRYATGEVSIDESSITVMYLGFAKK